jgi:hypothetical protein
MNDTPSNLQDKVNKAVWAACDSFRGTVDASVYLTTQEAAQFLGVSKAFFRA